MSAKQYDRYLRRLSAVQHSTRRVMRTSVDEEEDVNEENDNEVERIPIPELTHIARTPAPRRLPPMIRQLDRGHTNTLTHGPSAPVAESYLHEASFVLNPLS